MIWSLSFRSLLLESISCLRLLPGVPNRVYSFSVIKRKNKEDAARFQNEPRPLCFPSLFSLKDAAHMKQDRDLDSIRNRDDFKKLIADLEVRAR
jgi:hypothetical protein